MGHLISDIISLSSNYQKSIAAVILHSNKQLHNTVLHRTV